MYLSKLIVAISLALSTSVAVDSVMAHEAGDILLRGRIVSVSPNDDSDNLFLNGSDTGAEGVVVDADVIPELDFTYMLSPSFGVELILGYSEHTITGAQTHSNLGDVIETKVLPPTLIFQYHYDLSPGVHSYFGAGINYTHFFDEQVVGPVLPNNGDDVTLDDSWGLAAQFGMDIDVNDDWFINLDLKYISIDTAASFTNVIPGTNATAAIDAEINPFVYGVGIGCRL